MAARGFTFVELLVVMLITAMAASIVVLNMPPPVGKVRTEADRFAARLAMASEQAIMTGTMIGLELEPSGYEFFEYDRGGWRPLDADVLGGALFPPDVAVDFELPEPARRNEEPREERRDEEVPTPNVFFSPTGETTALEISFQSRRALLALSLDNTGNLEGPRVEQ